MGDHRRLVVRRPRPGHSQRSTHRHRHHCESDQACPSPLFPKLVVGLLVGLVLGHHRLAGRALKVEKVQERSMWIYSRTLPQHRHFTISIHTWEFIFEIMSRIH